MDLEEQKPWKSCSQTADKTERRAEKRTYIWTYVHFSMYQKIKIKREGAGTNSIYIEVCCENLYLHFKRFFTYRFFMLIATTWSKERQRLIKSLLVIIMRSFVTGLDKNKLSHSRSGLGKGIGVGPGSYFFPWMSCCALATSSSLRKRASSIPMLSLT